MTTIRKAGAWVSFIVGMVGLPKVAQGVWELTAPANPSRSWTVNLSSGIGFDDNVNTASRGKQSSGTANIVPQLLVSFPMERTALGLRYTYNATYFTQRQGSPIVESHVADATLSWRITPRWNASVNNSVRRGLDPGLVVQQGGVPIIVQQRGDYLYNSLGSRLSYDLTRRWTLSINGGWELWSYDVPAIASNNNYNSYSLLMSAVYSVDPRTFVGVNYQYSTVQYDNPGPDNARNSQGNAGYISLVHQFNPQLSAQLNAGMELRTFGSGTNSVQQTAPSFSGTLAYNFGPADSIMGTVAYYLSTTEVGAFRSTDTASARLQLNHRLTTKFHAAVSGAFVRSSFQNPTPGSFLPAGLVEDAVEANLILAYSFQRWLESNVGYTYDIVSSQIGGRSFDRNRVTISLRLSY